MSGTEWTVWSVLRSDGATQAVGTGTRPEAEAMAAERNGNAARVMTGGDVAFVALPPGRVPSLADLPPAPVRSYRKDRWHESIRLTVPPGHPDAQELQFFPAEGPRRPLIVAVTEADLDELRSEISTSPPPADRKARAIAGLAAFLAAPADIQDEVWHSLSPQRRQQFRSFVNSGRPHPSKF